MFTLGDIHCEKPVMILFFCTIMKTIQSSFWCHGILTTHALCTCVSVFGRQVLFTFFELWKSLLPYIFDGDRQIFVEGKQLISNRLFHSICVQYVALWWKIQHAWICAFFIFSVSNTSLAYKSRILLSIRFYFQRYQSLNYVTWHA